MNRWDITVKQSNYDFNPFRESDHGKYFKTITILIKVELIKPMFDHIF